MGGGGGGGGGMGAEGIYRGARDMSLLRLATSGVPKERLKFKNKLLEVSLFKVLCFQWNYFNIDHPRKEWNVYEHKQLFKKVPLKKI